MRPLTAQTQSTQSERRAEDRFLCVNFASSASVR